MLPKLDNDRRHMPASFMKWTTALLFHGVVVVILMVYAANCGTWETDRVR